MSNRKPYRYDLNGQKFGRLEVIRFYGNIDHITYWVCKCDCGNEAIVRTTLLRNGATKSCGCIVKENAAKMGRATKKYKSSDRKLMNVWKTMIYRCESPKSNRYKNYGGRGIKVCDEWHDVDVFTDWAESHGYKRGLTIDRIDINGDYCPENCRFISYKEQANNRNNNVFLEYNGEKRTVSNWADITGIPYGTLHYRIKKQWRIEDILTVPVSSHNNNINKRNVTKGV